MTNYVYTAPVVLTIRSTVLIAAAAAATLVAMPANAAVYLFSVSGPGASASGNITTVDGTNGSAVTAVTGTVSYAGVNGGGPFTMTTLSSYAAATNRYYTSGPFADFGGISFNTNTGGAFNLGGGGTGPSGLVINTAVLNPIGYAGVLGSTSVDTVATSAVPEPATWAMMLLGFGILGFGMRSRRKQSVRVTYA